MVAEAASGKSKHLRMRDKVDARQKGRDKSGSPQLAASDS